jgi:hypothetical protein
MCVNAEHGIHLGHQSLRVVQLVISWVILSEEAARISTAWITRMLPVQTVAIAESLVWLPGTLLTKSLVVGGIRGKAADLRHGQVHALQQRGKLIQII